MRKVIYFIAAVFMLAPGAKAQSLEDIKTQMLKDWNRAKAYNKEYLDAMPADKYSFKVNDSVRNFAQQMLHLANGNVFLVSQVSAEKTPGWFSFRLEQRPAAQVKDTVV